MFFRVIGYADLWAPQLDCYSRHTNPIEHASCNQMTAASVFASPCDDSSEDDDSPLRWKYGVNSDTDVEEDGSLKASNDVVGSPLRDSLGADFGQQCECGALLFPSLYDCLLPQTSCLHLFPVQVSRSSFAHGIWLRSCFSRSCLYVFSDRDRCSLATNSVSSLFTSSYSTMGERYCVTFSISFNFPVTLCCLRQNVGFCRFSLYRVELCFLKIMSVRDTYVVHEDESQALICAALVGQHITSTIFGYNHELASYDASNTDLIDDVGGMFTLRSMCGDKLTCDTDLSNFEFGDFGGMYMLQSICCGKGVYNVEVAFDMFKCDCELDFQFLEVDFDCGMLPLTYPH